MTVTETMTNPQRILKAASTLTSQGAAPFSAESLVVEAWTTCPTAFGLRGYEAKHPDCNKSLCLIVGKRGLVAKGYLKRVGPKVYALTPQGQRAAEQCNGTEPLLPLEAKPAEPEKGIPVKLSRFLEAAQESDAWIKYDEGRVKEITVTDATRLWGINQLTGNRITSAMQTFTDELRELEMAADGKAVTREGRVIEPSEVRALANLHDTLLGRFERCIEVMKRRKGA